ncbi:SWIM zinc finger family protein [Streptomyces beihaiensis]|uniref:SWIM zinc finger family protein n=1 Tax=Streptomyces beihaiensis TaxID=2984495 RepID=A0ABT3U0Y7_9ACTN|nr:SWIM zinc finger family protein [Streptomyces beihaiensis]MCX3062992.1 SWIM zinc finger family protein [Streptomyces beihaiensis]
MTPHRPRRRAPHVPGRARAHDQAQARYADTRRTFPPLPPRETSGGAPALTWWGNAWVEALEDTALDPARLARGRGYAERGHVDAITVTPGRAVAYVHGSRPRPYRAELRLRTLSDDAWERFAQTAAARADHMASLLDKDVPHALAAAVDLLPTVDDLVPECTCPDRAEPCKHAAALCYQVARLVDEDPFVLFLLRGRGEQELLADLTRRNATHTAAEQATAHAPALDTVSAREALAADARAVRLPPLPPEFPPRPAPERPPSYPEAPDAPDPLALDLLATQAAARAHTLLTTGTDPLAGLTPWQDAVRLAAAHPGSGLTAATRALYASLARGTGRTPVDLARAVAAWRQGGLQGLAVLEEEWDPPAGPFDRARPALIATGRPDFRPHRNRLTARSLQLRLGRDGLWYGYESDADRDDWWPRGDPAADPVTALDSVLGGP